MNSLVPEMQKRETQDQVQKDHVEVLSGHKISERMEPLNGKPESLHCKRYSDRWRTCILSCCTKGFCVTAFTM